LAERAADEIEAAHREWMLGAADPDRRNSRRRHVVNEAASAVARKGEPAGPTFTTRRGRLQRRRRPRPALDGCARVFASGARLGGRSQTYHPKRTARCPPAPESWL
jgi:hypothetical protein